MEARLFFISIWCGIYGLFLRAASKREDCMKKIWTPMILNSLFWATGAAMFGMLIASYFEKIEDMTFYSALFAVVGFVIGAIIGYLKGRDDQKREALLKDNLEWADTGFSAILLASFVMFFIVQAFKIPSGSMRMTFVEGDHLFVNKFIYGVPVPFTDKKVLPMKHVLRGDIVIFRFPTDDKDSPHYGKDFIKRVVATEGETVQVINKQVFVNGVAMDEPHKQHIDPSMYPGIELNEPASFQERWQKREFQGNEVRDNFGPITVPAGDIFVMGDNRDRSYDSRFWGPLPLTEIKGKAWLLYWPVTRLHVVK